MKPQVEQDLAHVLLTELLAYQFASPVRWIETQDVLLGDFKAERLVEIGPSATLAGMAQRTLKAHYQGFDAALSLERQVLCYAKDGKEIYYEYEPEPESEAAPASEPAADAAAATTPIPAAAPTATPTTSGPVAAIEDTPLKAIQVLHALVAHKIRKPLDQVPVTKPIKDMVGGKSTVQNEILGDLAKEFSASPEKAEEVPLGELAEQLSDNFSGKLGKHTTSLISRFVASKMPGGFAISAVRKYLQSQWGLGSGRQDAVLLIALTKEPSSRFASEAEAKAFLDANAQAYATSEGITLSSVSAPGNGGPAAGVDPAVSAAALEEVTKDQKYMARQQLEIYARYLQTDLRDGHKQFTAQKEATELLQKELDLWLAEHGEFYAEGIKPIFSPLKSRIYDSYWNWARQECFRMLFDIVWGRLDTVDREIVARCISIMNRANPTLIDYMVYYIENVPTERGPTFELAKNLAQQLMENCKEVLGSDPVYKDVQYPTGPKTSVNEKGIIEYEEVPRPACRKLEQYVLQMAAGDELTRDTESPKAKLEDIYSQIEVSDDVEAAFELLKSRIADKEPLAKGMRPDIVPFLHLKERVGEGWRYSKSLTAKYLTTLENAAREGVSFASKMILITGAGRGSIGVKILEGLLSGGAKVVVTTSRFSKETTDFYQDIYTRTGSAGSSLVVVPFNQASQTDVKALVDYIYSQSGLNWDLDAVIPFAAIPEGGMEIDGIESKSELAHRLMLTNLLRLLGQIKLHKEAINAVTRPAQVILPLSPNHGTFGGDGLYSESKLALETLFNRWSSESWGSYLTICGAVIGWTRGTGLMSQNNIVADGIEKLGVRTFSQQEMAFNILGLLTPTIVNLCQKSPVFADLNGGMQFVPELKSHMAALRRDLVDTAELRRAVAIETSLEHKVVHGPRADSPFQKEYIKPRSNLKFEFPELRDYKDLPNTKLRGLIDLDKVAVVTGFAEVGPWGNSRTRWEIEAHGEFSIEGAIEMAWIMGLIKYHNGPLKGKPYTGWVDAKTQEPVEEMDIKGKYEGYILEHSGIRLIEPDLIDFDPNKKQFLQEIIVAHDLEPFEASRELAEQFQHEQGDKVEIFPVPESDEFTVRFLKGARIWVPKALQYNRLVAGQIPTGWDAKRYGVPEDIIQQVDPISLFALVSTVEALLSAGVTDPYEFYKYVHVSEIGNASGSGMGGMTALRKMFKDRYMDKSVQNDILQESFINTMSAWINMLLLSSSGPLKTPVGACATSVESLDTGLELIRNGTARIVIVGGYDDLKEEGVQEFGNMNATSNSLTEMEHGRTPREMSRPTTTTRSGFMEAHGAGIQILMSGQLAVDMGVPVYGIVALTATASDKIGRSIPAPGKGILTIARESAGSVPSPLLDIDYRRRQLDTRVKQISAWAEDEKALVESLDLPAPEYAARLEQIASDMQRQIKEAQHTWGTGFYSRDPRIAPLRGALAVWGLTIDDIGIASFHGTSTKANDKNESAAIHEMLSHLGRTKGNPVLGIFQKYLTGHPKGAAGAWMLNGVMQSINTGLVPGNRNADNVDPALEQFDHIVFPSVTLETYGIKAGTVTSFGFGQKGAIALVVHPDYFFSALDPGVYEQYKRKVASRHDKTYRYLHDAMSNHTMFRAKDKAPYTDDQENTVYLDPKARVDDSHKYNALSTESTTSEMLSSVTDEAVGVDVELLSAINIENGTFIDRNFTKQEQDYCWAAPDARASFAGTWSAKEAVFKCLRVEGKGSGAPLKDIEIIRTKSGPSVRLHGDALSALGTRSVKVSISHDEVQAIAVAVASK